MKIGSGTDRLGCAEPIFLLLFHRSLICGAYNRHVPGRLDASVDRDEIAMNSVDTGLLK
jgi:hypothetical protein